MANREFHFPVLSSFRHLSPRYSRYPEGWTSRRREFYCALPSARHTFCFPNIEFYSRKRQNSQFITIKSKKVPLLGVPPLVHLVAGNEPLQRRTVSLIGEWQPSLKRTQIDKNCSLLKKARKS